MQIFHTGDPLCRRTAVALGNFDGVHLGHAALLPSTAAEARTRGGFSLG